MGGWKDWKVEFYQATDLPTFQSGLFYNPSSLVIIYSFKTVQTLNSELYTLNS